MNACDMFGPFLSVVQLAANRRMQDVKTGLIVQSLYACGCLPLCLLLSFAFMSAPCLVGYHSWRELISIILLVGGTGGTVA
ncbi:hypothetical protein EJ04DRAFT_177380 [Polyplosphaeria fusca]|uniref:Uncharacterized protein n=1 Tax=Polyplosphaeria fusca TaxID=682080 RepID=A0A9P4R048_9PLEO|nr:hypothetical protein EJ04DRAFT_177380 [Polyplosphaeria fusca]